jgi:hypothetical protein
LEARGTSRYTMLAMAGDEGLEPSYLDLETSVLAAGRISRKLMAELTGIEPVPADRQSAILPIDHSSGSLPWIRTTISEFRAQRPAIGRRGNFEIVKELAAGERFERPYPDSKSRVLPLDDPASCLQRYCFHAAHTQHRRFIDVMAEPPAVRARTVHQFAVIAAAIAVELRCKLDCKAFEFNRLCIHSFGSSEENRTPISALKGPHPGR